MTQASREGIRVVLDLAMFFEGKRKKCYYFIDLTKNRFVRNVCEDIKSRFRIQNSISFEVNGVYVPKNEDARVLFNEDVIKVFDAKKMKDNLNSLNLNGEKEGHEDFDAIRFVSDSCNGMKLKRSILSDKFENDEITGVSKPKKKCSTKIVDMKEKTDNYAKNVKKSKKCAKNKTLTSEIGNVEIETFTEIERSAELSNMSDNYAQLIGTSKAEIKKTTSNIEESAELSNMSDNDKKLIGMSNAEIKKTTSNIEDNTPSKTFQEQEKEFDVGDNLKMPCVPTRLDLETDGAPPEHNRTCQVNHNISLDTIKDCDKALIEMEETFCKKRRRRRRKKTQKLNDLSSEQNCFSESFPVIPFVDNSIKKAVHIKFSDNDENYESHTNDSNCNNSCENNRINSLTSYQQPVKPSTNLENSKGFDYEKVYESKHSSIVDSPVVLMDNNGFISNNFIHSSSKTPVIFECKKINKSTNKEPEKNENDQQFLKYPLLNSTPKVNDIIAFKKWKMDVNYCPGLSSFIAAKVLHVSENEDHIKLKILNGHTEFEEPKGKFSLEEEAEEEEKDEKKESEQSKQNEINDIEMNMSDLLEIRIMFP